MEKKVLMSGTGCSGRELFKATATASISEDLRICGPDYGISFTGVIVPIDEYERLKNENDRKDELLKRARYIMDFHASRCPLHPHTNHSGCEEHLAEYRNIIKDIDELLAKK
jgi:hypothetical protein